MKKPPGMRVGSLARAVESASVMPLGLMRDLQRLYEESPQAMELFARSIAEPPHTLSITLNFHGHRLVHAEQRVTAK